METVSLTPLQRTFLKRLQRLVALDRYAERHLPFSAAETSLIKHCVYSVYQDCLELDLEPEARAILRASAALQDPGDVIDRSGG
jgi:hypothetical protein